MAKLKQGEVRHVDFQLNDDVILDVEFRVALGDLEGTRDEPPAQAELELVHACDDNGVDLLPRLSQEVKDKMLEHCYEQADDARYDDRAFDEDADR